MRPKRMRVSGVTARYKERDELVKDKHIVKDTSILALREMTHKVDVKQLV